MANATTAPPHHYCHLTSNTSPPLTSHHHHYHTGGRTTVEGHAQAAVETRQGHAQTGCCGDAAGACAGCWAFGYKMPARIAFTK